MKTPNPQVLASADLMQKQQARDQALSRLAVLYAIKSKLVDAKLDNLIADQETSVKSSLI